MKLSVVVLLCALVAVQANAALFAGPLARAIGGVLQFGYYNDKCKGEQSVEDVVKGHVLDAIKKDHTVGAKLIRLVFHDCFVRGCDGSVLLGKSDQIPYPETDAGKNFGLAGFDLLEDIKADLERRWRGKVSCADILVYAARDAASILSDGKIAYQVPAGRLDGIVSDKDQAQEELPGSTDSVQQLMKNFDNKGFNAEELVILSGAHSIGVCHCSAFTDRLSAPASQIDTTYQNQLKYKCGGGDDPSVPNNVRDQDDKTAAKYTNSLDNSFYLNSFDLKVNFFSDWQLMTRNTTRTHVREYADNATAWNEDFAASMVKLSNLSMPADSNKGGIRKKCSSIDLYPYPY